MVAEERKPRTVAEVMVRRQSELLEDWIRNIAAVPGNRTLALMSEEALRKEATELLQTLVTAFSSEEYENLAAPQFAASVRMLQDISRSRAKGEFSPSETALFVLSLKEALLQYLQADMADDPELLSSEVVKMNRVIDSLSLITFESYVRSREEVIVQQTRSLLELATPVIELWERIVLLPMVGVIDSARAEQMSEELLNGIVRAQALVAIIDVTGVPVMDSFVALHLTATVSAARMLGAETIITGFSPAAAQVLVKLGVDFSGLTTRGSLRRGVADAFRMVGLQITS